MLNLPLNAEHQKRVWLTSLHIAQRNGFPTAILQKPRRQIKQKTKHTAPHTNMNPPPKKSDIHLHIPAHTQDHEPIQKQKHKDSIQMPQYHRQPYQTSKGPQHSTPQ